MILRGSVGGYGLGKNHFHLTVHPLSKKEHNLKRKIIFCTYPDSMLTDLKSPDPKAFKLQHVLGQNIEVEGTFIDDRKFKVDKAILL